MLKSLLCAAVLLSPVAALAQAAHPAEQIAVAERAFAADGLAMGVKGSFLKWSAPDAIFLLAAPTPVRPRLAARPDPKPGEEPPLVWWPTWTAIAKSGDLGVSTGPVLSDGKRDSHYFTVWKKQADGSWKWIYDGGVGVDGSAEPDARAPTAHLPVAVVGSDSPEEAMTQVRAVEGAFTVIAAQNQKAAHLAVLADDARLYVAPRAPAKGVADFPAALDALPATIKLSAPSNVISSAAGDLVFDYGKADFGRPGWYVHIWQKRPDGDAAGWKLVFSQLLPSPTPAN
jgi:ketosteroid isomerase-like protein